MEEDFREILKPVEYSSAEDSEESDQDDVERNERKERKHHQLLKDISKLSGNKKSVKKPLRLELSKDVSDFTWASGKANKVELHDLVKSLSGTTATNSELRKKLQNLEEGSKVLDTPLPKPQLEKVERAVAYEETAKDISKWEPTVIKNRKAEHLSFPLKKHRAPRSSVKSMVARKKGSQTKTALEEEIEAVLKGSSRVLERKDKELTAAEEEALKNVDVEEALERRKELQRLRVLQSYYETKCKRMKKIKSKKYHRILKRSEKKKQEKTDLEELAKQDPELFQSELDKAEKLRAQERASLRHRKTTKWSRNLITKGHLSNQDKQAINEQIRISREMTEHKVQFSDTEDEEDEQNNGTDVAELKLLSRDAILEENPWLLGSEEQLSHEKEDRVAPLRLKKLKPVTNKEKKTDEVDSDEDVDSSSDEWDKAANNRDHTIKKISNSREGAEAKVEKDEKLLKGEISEEVDDSKFSESDSKDKNMSRPNNELSENGARPTDPPHTIKQIKNASRRKTKLAKETETLMKENEKNNKKKEQQKEHLVKADQFLSVEKHALELVPVEDSEGDNDEEDERLMSIREAFASDDVIEEFAVDKRDAIDKAKPKDIDLTLPGWGSWGGAGLRVSKKKRKKFTKKARPQKERQDEKLPMVIINEKKSEKFVKNQVANLPFPFGTKEQFEKSIRQPLGPQWNTPSVTHKLIQPRVTKTLGAVIDPIQATKQLKKRTGKETEDNERIQHKAKKKK